MTVKGDESPYVEVVIIDVWRQPSPAEFGKEGGSFRCCGGRGMVERERCRTLGTGCFPDRLPHYFLILVKEQNEDPNSRPLSRTQFQCMVIFRTRHRFHVDCVCEGSLGVPSCGRRRSVPGASFSPPSLGERPTESWMLPSRPTTPNPKKAEPPKTDLFFTVVHGYGISLFQKETLYCFLKKGCPFLGINLAVTYLGKLYPMFDPLFWAG